MSAHIPILALAGMAASRRKKSAARLPHHPNPRVRVAGFFIGAGILVLVNIQPAPTPGYLADLYVIDLPRIKLRKPWRGFDLPAGGKRLLQKADGYVATVKSGEVTFRDGEVQAVWPGRVIRGPQGIS